MAESYDDGETVSAVARRYALSPRSNCLLASGRASAVGGSGGAGAIVCSCGDCGADVGATCKGCAEATEAEDGPYAGVIELEIDGVAMRVGRGADARPVAAVIRALKATT